MTIALLLMGALVCGQTLAPNHWLDEELRFLWNRGELWQFSPLQRPFVAAEVLNAGALPHDEPAERLLSRLPRPGANAVLFTWSRSEGAVRNRPFHVGLRPAVGAVVAPGLQVLTSFYIDNQLDADSSYIGKRQSGLAAYCEQAYMLFRKERFTLRFGRDFLVWGPGLDASLLFSDAARPLDHVYAAWESRRLQFSFMAAALDFTYSSDAVKPERYNRYLSGHRLEWRPSPFIRLAVSETALYGGAGAVPDAALLNPFIFFTGEEHNGPQTANVMAAVDFAVSVRRRWMFYGSFLLDDVQLECSGVDALGEPPEFGLLAGGNWADPLNLRGVDCYAEYTRVANRTYNGQGGEWEKYLHRGVPIGHFLGNDFERMLVGLRRRIGPDWRLKAQFEHRRRGEGRIDRPFDTPWRNVPPGTYREPFPTGVVERTDRLLFSLRRQWNWWGAAQFDAAYSTIKNAENQRGRNEAGWEFALRLSLEFVGTLASE